MTTATGASAFAQNSPVRQAGVPVPEPQVQRQITIQGETLNGLIENFKELAMRLGPVLREETPEKSETAKQGIGEYMVPLANALCDHNTKMVSLGVGIRNLLNRLEL